MGDKIKVLEERLDRLEDKLRTTFLEVEKRFEDTKSGESSFSVLESRIQEMEDLLLLIQLDVTKLKEKAGEGFEMGANVGSDVLHRIERLEANAGGDSSITKGILDAVDERISKLESSYLRSMPADKMASLDEIQRRLERLEKEKSVSVLKDVKSILSS